MEISTLLSVVSLSVAATMLIVNVLNTRRNRRADDQQDAAERTTLIVKIESINAGINEIKTDVRGLRGDVRELQDRMIIVEQSVKSAHHRVDRIEGKEDKP